MIVLNVGLYVVEGIEKVIWGRYGVRVGEMWVVVVIVVMGVKKKGVMKEGKRGVKGCVG